MKLRKRLLRNAWIQEILCWLAANYIRLVSVTTRWTVIGGPELRQLANGNRPIVACFWHGRLLLMGPGWPYHERTHMLISSHPDGQLIARTIRHFGSRTVVGSKTRGGGGALRAMLKLLAAGDIVGITPDGPAGPRMRVSPGAVTTARMASGVLLPIACSISRRILLSTWDRFVLPLPFGRGVYIWGEPIEVARDADDITLEAVRQRLEIDLNAITAEADRLCGKSAIEPASVEASPDAAATARSTSR